MEHESSNLRRLLLAMLGLVLTSCRAYRIEPQSMRALEQLPEHARLYEEWSSPGSGRVIAYSDREVVAYVVRRVSVGYDAMVVCFEHEGRQLTQPHEFVFSKPDNVAIELVSFRKEEYQNVRDFLHHEGVSWIVLPRLRCRSSRD